MPIRRYRSVAANWRSPVIKTPGNCLAKRASFAYQVIIAFKQEHWIELQTEVDDANEFITIFGNGKAAAPLVSRLAGGLLSIETKLHAFVLAF